MDKFCYYVGYINLVNFYLFQKEYVGYLFFNILNFFKKYLVNLYLLGERNLKIFNLSVFNWVGDYRVYNVIFKNFYYYIIYIFVINIRI